MFGNRKTVIYILIALTLVFVLRSNAFAQIKDTDGDGVSDEAEVKMYKTDPNNFDTDNDGFSDGLEILNKSNPLDSTDSPILKITDQNRKLLTSSDPIQWYLSRISGIVAFILLTLVVSFGLIQTSKSLLKFRVMSPLTAMETHRLIAWSGIIAVIIHFGSLLFDQVLKLKLYEALIPFTVQRDFKTTMGFDFNLPISLGIFGFYFIFILISTSELRNKIVSVKVWRAIHYTGFLGYVLFLIHGFVTGSDSKEVWMRAIYIGSMTLVFGLLLARIFKKKLFYPKVKKQAVKSIAQPQLEVIQVPNSASLPTTPVTSLK